MSAAPLGDTLIGTVVCDVIVPGDPTTKARARTRKDGRTYTPRRTREAEEAIRWNLRAVGVRPDGDHLLGVRLEFRQSTGQRRDLDNLTKLVFDACNGFVWADDFQVVTLHADVERRSADPGFTLRVERLARYSADCGTCGRVIPARTGASRDRVGYCSRECYDAAQRTGEVAVCVNCGDEWYRSASYSDRQACSKPCADALKRGQPRPPGAWQKGHGTEKLV